MLEGILKNILVTVVYYDVMGYPMTAFEIWKYLIREQGAGDGEQEIRSKENEGCSLLEITEGLESGEIKKYIEKYQGFYFLRGRQFLVGQRLERNKISEAKYRIILRTIKILKFIPYVEMIAVVGRVAMKNAEKGSDLGLLFVFKKNHLFTGRFLTYLLISFLGKRRREEKKKNRICLNHFLSDNYLISVKDLFSSHEYSFMLPVFNCEAYDKLLEKNNWIKNYRPNFDKGVSSPKEERDGHISKTIRGVLEVVFSFGFVENNLKKIQSAKIRSNPKTQRTGGVIIYSDDELAFWPEFEKQGPLVFSKLKEKLNELKIG
jgi:hypothetical protein